MSLSFFKDLFLIFLILFFFEHGGVGPEKVFVPGQGEHLHLVPEAICHTYLVSLVTVALVLQGRVICLLYSTPINGKVM